jgi:leader peptidase (prepilin peptidase)/N-methyltransferase
MCKEMIFLLPIIICAVAAYWLIRESAPGGYLADTGLRTWWLGFSQRPVVAGLLGSLCGYFIGGGIVWAARILGTLAFGKEAMGLGDVHLMGAAGAVIGPVLIVVAFFIAPFLGLGWASFQMIFKKTRQIPYGPFLSMGVFAVMILHDRIFNHLIFIFYR